MASILITGCSAGIGLACAREMKTRGWRVFATARKPDNIRRLRDDVGVERLYLDYAEPASIKAAAEEVLAATGGKLAALFNNGAYGQPGAVEDLRPDVLRAQFEANVIGWHNLNRAPHLCDAHPREGAHRVVRVRPCRGTLSRSLLRLEIRHRGARRLTPPRACGHRHQSHSHRAGTHLFPLP
jgi:NAD(P)-dependent dehydrogenase (short-subunit alcohol dehydrogenase family)